MAKTYLTPRESQVLQLLSNGEKNKDIRERLNISAPNLHVVLCRIRQKTGIVNTKDTTECTRSQRQTAGIRPKAKTALPVSETQMTVLRQMAKGFSYAQIASNLEIGVQSVQNHAYHACKRAGITGQGHNRTAAIRAYIERLDTPEHDPLDDY